MLIGTLTGEQTVVVQVGEGLAITVEKYDAPVSNDRLYI